LDWWWAILFTFGGLILLMTIGVPVAFAFFTVILAGMLFFWGGHLSLALLPLTIMRTLANYSLVAITMFILMGEVIFQSGIGVAMIDAFDKWLGRLPGRLGLLAVVSGVGLSMLTGASMATVGLLGSALVPEMEKRGYKTQMTVGPILGSCGLAVMIPPSAMGVILAYLAEVSVARVLIAGIIPGLMMATLYATYIYTRCRLQPHLAPPYEAPAVPLSDKLISTLRDVAPLGLVVFLVTGTILLGIATPSEAAAAGAFGCFVLAAAYRKINWNMLKRALLGTARIVCMVLIIIAASIAFGQLLAFSGASKGLIELALSFPLAPVAFVIMMMLIMVFLGMFMDSLAQVMIVVPIFFPIIRTLGLDPIWFAVLMLLNVEMGPTTPPYGMALFIMKGVAPRGTTMGDVYRGGIPFLICDAIVMALMIAFPIISLWLPGLIVQR
jgi:tripartite ATP-independent transporter DctM subunit